MKILSSLLCAVVLVMGSGSAIGADKPVSSLSETQLKKINDLLAAKGQDQPIDAKVVAKLKLSQNASKQIALQDTKSGNAHLYSLFPDGGMLFALLNRTTAYTYRVDSNFKVLAAVSMTNFVPSDIKDPEAGVRAELAYWAMIADQL